MVLQRIYSVIQNKIQSEGFRHIQAQSGIIQAYIGIFRTLCNPGIFRFEVYAGPETYLQSWHIHTTLVYSEPRKIKNGSIFGMRGIFRTLANTYHRVFCKNN